MLECGDGIQQESLSSDSDCDGLKVFDSVPLDACNYRLHVLSD